MLSGYFDSIAEAVAGNNGALTAITTSLKGVGDNEGRLPLINAPVRSIPAVTDALSGFRVRLYDALKSLSPGVSSAVVQNTVFNALGPGGAKVLGDKNGVGGITAADVFVSNLSSTGVGISIDLFKTTAYNATFGLGVDSIPFKTSGAVAVPVSVDLRYRNFNFGFQNSAAYFTTASADELQFQINARLPEDPIYAGLGFLRFSASDATPGNNDFSMAFTANVASNYSLTNSRLNGAANLNIALDADIPSSGLPRFKTNLKLDWQFNGVAPGRSSFAAPTLQLTDVRMNIGSMLGNVLKPVAEQIQAVTDPFQPLLDLLSKRIPGVSDLYETMGGDPVTMMTMVKLYANANNLPPHIFDALEMAVRLRELADSIASLSSGGDSSYVSLGNFNIAGPGGSSLLSAPAAALGSTGSNWSSLAASPGGVGFTQVKQQIVSLLGSGKGNEVNSLFDRHNRGVDGNGVTFAVPLVEDPGTVAMGLLLGQDVDLVSMTANFGIKFDDSISFRPFPLIELGIRGGAEINAFARLGFDTRGLRDSIAPMFNGGNFNGALIRNGLWIDRATGLSLSGGIELFADAGIPGLATVGVDGGVSASATLRLSNPNQFEKIRPFAGDLGSSLFVVAGTVDAEASLNVSIGVEFAGVFVGYRDSWTFAEANLFRFTTESLPIPRVLQPVEPPPVHLGSYDPATKTLTLAMGTNAGLRGDPDLIAVTDEKFTVRRVKWENALGVMQSSDSLIVSAFGITERFDDVDHVVAFGGSGDDSITVVDYGFRTGRTDYWLTGDEGDDRIVVDGAVDAILDGGVGNDFLDGGYGYEKLSISGGPDTNEIVIGKGRPGDISPLLNEIIVNGGTLSRLVLDDSDSTVAKNYSFIDEPNSTTWQLLIDSADGSRRTINYDRGVAIRLLGGKGNDTFNGYASRFTTLNGGGGDDTFDLAHFSPLGLPSLNYTVDIAGGEGHDTVLVSQANAPAGSGGMKLAYNTIRWGANYASGATVRGVENTRAMASPGSTVVVDAWNNTPIVVKADIVQVNADMYSGEDATVTLQDTSNLFFVDTVGLPRVVPLGIDAQGAFVGAPGQRKLRMVSDQPITTIGLYGSDVRIDPSAILFSQLSTVQLGGTVGERSTLTITPPDPNEPDLVADGIEYGFSADQVTVGGFAIPAFGFHEIKLLAGQGNDVVNVSSVAPGQRLNLFGGFGDDILYVGDDSTSFSSSTRGAVVWTGGVGEDAMQVSDRGAQGPQSYQIFSGNVSNAIGGSAGRADGSTESYSFFGSYYYSNVFTIEGNSTQNWTLSGGLADDEYRLTSLSLYSQALTLDPSDGNDLLVLDNRTGSPFFQTVLYEDRVRLGNGLVFYNSFEEINYDGSNRLLGFENTVSDFYVHSTPTNVPLFINGTNDAIDTIFLGTDDGVTGTLSNLRGPISINLNLQPAGKQDAIHFFDTTEVVPHAFSIDTNEVTRDGSTLATIYGHDLVTIATGSGNDTFAINTLKNGAAIRISGGDGDDTIDLGNGNLTANITNVSAINFDGQEGSDKVNLQNRDSVTGFSYRRNFGAFGVTKDAYVLNISETSIERLVFDAGSGTDTFVVSGVASGTSLDILGGAGLDVLLLGSVSSHVNGILGPINFDTGADAGRVQLTDSASTEGKTAHLKPNSLGAHPDDTLFGPGGSLQFTTLADLQTIFFTQSALSITLGSGNDTIDAVPLATGSVAIDGRAPVGIPGDSLNLRVAGAEDYAIVPVNATDGSLTSTNLRPLRYLGFETVTVQENSAPFDVLLDHPRIAENLPAGAFVGSLNTLDPDPDETFSYILLSETENNDNQHFSLDANGNLQTNVSFDFETRASYTIEVQSTDQYGLSIEKTLEIQVVNQPEGTTGNDAFVVTYVEEGLAVTVSSAGAAPISLGTFSSDTSIVIYGFGGTDSVRIIGTSNSDVIRAISSAFVIVNDTPLALDGTETLTLAGGSGNDTYQFAADNSLGLITLDEAQGGIDTLDFSVTEASGISLRLALATVQIVNENLSLILRSGSTFENVIGSSGSDTITGNNLANILRGGLGSDVLLGSSGNDLMEGGADNDTVDGGAGNDIYLFDADSNLGSEILSDTIGIDTISFFGTDADVVFSLGLMTEQSVNGGLLMLTLSADSIFDNLTGGAGQDTLTGNSIANTLIGGPGDDLLQGVAGNDIYLFDADSPLGHDLLTDTAGVDTISFTDTSAGVALNLGAAEPQDVNGWLIVTLASPAAFDNLIGGDGNDALTGNSSVNSLTGGGGDDELAGGPGNDSYFFDADLNLGSDTVLENFGDGTDLLNFTATTTRTLSVDLGIPGVQEVVPGQLYLQLLSDNVIERVYGGSLGDVLTGNMLANTISGGFGNDVLNGEAGQDILIGAAGNDMLIGGAGDDIYTMDADTAIGIDTVDESGGGIDTLDYTSTTTLAVLINLSLANVTQIVNFNHSVVLQSGTNIENVKGGALNDALTGNGLANNLTGNAGNDILNGLDGDDLLIGNAGNDTLNGGPQNDVYQFDADTILGRDIINDASGVDTLDFALTSTAGITLDLAIALSQSLNGNAVLTLPVGTIIENVLGTAQHDTILGNDAHNILIGNAGNDILRGRSGRDLLIGGLGSDLIDGGDGDDILIAGRTINDGLVRNLNEIQTEWTSARTYAARTASIRAGVGASAVSFQAKVTVLRDAVGAVDTLTGGTGQDWYFAALDDVISDLLTGEVLDRL